jgi:hypothetical protein
MKWDLFIDVHAVPRLFDNNQTHDGAALSVFIVHAIPGYFTTA